MEDEDLELLLSMDGSQDVSFPESPPTSTKIPLQSSPAIKGEETTITTRMATTKLRFPSTVSKMSSLPSSGTTIIRDPPKEQPGEVSTLGYCSDEEQAKPIRDVSMAVFKDVVKEALRQSEPDTVCRSLIEPAGKASISGADVEKYSGLRIKDRQLSASQVHRTLSDLRFVGLRAIKNAMMCEKFKGSWATVGILTEKGLPKLSSKGKNYVVWKLGTLDNSLVSLFLFGAAYIEHWKEPPGSILAIFNANVRDDSKEPSLSIFCRDQAMRLGTSADYRVCNGKRKDGTACTMVLKRQSHGQFCQFHAKVVQQEFRLSRPELSGGKFTVVGPDIRRGYSPKPVPSLVKDEVFGRPLKRLTTSDLKDLLSNSEKMPTKSHSQGKRFLEIMSQRTSETQDSASKGMKRQNYHEATKPGKRHPLVERQMAANNSAPKHVAKTNKGKSEWTGQVMELDIDDDHYVDDAMVHAMSYFKKLPGTK